MIDIFAEENNQEKPVEETKQCTKCGETKPKSEFKKSNDRKSRVSSACKECHKKNNPRMNILRRKRIKKYEENMPTKEFESITKKKCITCKKEKTLDQFNSDKSMKDGRKNKCKDCKNAVSRKYHYGTKLGIDYNIVKEMTEEQDGCCAICGKKGDLHLDHNHESGSVRELLCHNCNIGLGLFREDVNALQKAIEYLQKHKDNPNPIKIKIKTVKIDTSKIKWPSIEYLIDEINKSSYCEVGRKLGVSNVAVKSHLVKKGVDLAVIKKKKYYPHLS